MRTVVGLMGVSVMLVTGSNTSVEIIVGYTKLEVNMRDRIQETNNTSNTCLYACICAVKHCILYTII